MLTIGLTLSSEEHGPAALVDQARRGEQAGFSFALISDHFHPWLDQQGQSPFVWAVLGGIARETSVLRVGTAVTCPLIRMHPALVAQAAATTATLFEGRFLLGVGTGERLNEHVTGVRWPPNAERRAMLEEAVGVIRRLWEGGSHSHEGRFYRVEHARLYTLPEPPPPLLIAASGRRSAELAGRLGDGLISTAPQRSLVETFEAAGGRGKPRYGQVKVCWAPSEQQATETAMRWWRLSGIPGELYVELATPADFAGAVATVRPEDLAGKITLGPDPGRHLEAIEEFARAGFDHVFVHQVGPDQDGFRRFYEREVLPQVSRLAVGGRA